MSIILLITLLWGFSYISMSFDHLLAYRNFFPKYPPIFLRYIRKIKLPIYSWLPIFSSLLLRDKVEDLLELSIKFPIIILMQMQGRWECKLLVSNRIWARKSLSYLFNNWQYIGITIPWVECATMPSWSSKACSQVNRTWGFWDMNFKFVPILSPTAR